MRVETDDLSLGIGKLRWKDGRTGVKTLYPNAQSTPGYESWNSRTGQPIQVLPGLHIPRFLLAAADALASAQVSFDASGISSVTLYCQPERDAVDWVDAQPAAAVERAANALAERFGFGPVFAEDLEQIWQIGDVRVELFLDTAELSMIIHRPAPA